VTPGIRCGGVKVPLSTAKVRIRGALPPYPFFLLAWFLIKHRDKSEFCEPQIVKVPDYYIQLFP